MLLAGVFVVLLAAIGFAARVPEARLGALWIVGLALVATLILRRKRVDRAIVGLVLAGIALDVLYASYTAWSERNPDAFSHVQYARYLLDRHSLPSAADCSECHHPPLYYIGAATVLATCERTGVLDAGVGLQLLSLSLFVTFLVSAGIVVDRLLPRRPERAVAMLLIAFWPYGVIHSVRVNSDALVCAIAGLVLLFLSNWYLRAKRRDLWIACVLVVVGVFAKASAIALALVVGLTFVRARNRPRALAPVACMFAACALLFLARSGTGLFGTANRNAAELTPRTPSFYLTFEPRDFVNRPFVVARKWQTNEPTYWNQLAKSSLFGVRNAMLFTFRREVEPNARLARAMNAGLLGLAALALFGVVRVPRRRASVRAFCSLAAIGLLSGGLAFHLLIPYSFHADFRFVLPVVVPLSILFALGLSIARQRRRPWWILWPLVAVAFAAMSVASFVPSTWTGPPQRATTALPTHHGAR